MSARSADRERQRRYARQADRRRIHKDKYANKASGTKAQTKPEDHNDERR